MKIFEVINAELTNAKFPNYPITESQFEKISITRWALKELYEVVLYEPDKKEAAIQFRLKLEKGTCYSPNSTFYGVAEDVVQNVIDKVWGSRNKHSL